MSLTPATASARRGRAYLWWALALLALIVAAWAAWVGVRGLIAAGELRATTPIVTALEKAVAAGDRAGAQRAAGQLQQKVASAQQLTSDPVWAVTEHLPLVGPDLAAVDAVARAAASVVHDGVLPVIPLVGTIDAQSFRLRGGTFALQRLAAAAPALNRVDGVVRTDNAAVQQVDVHAALPPVRSAVTRFQGDMQQLAALTDSADRAAVLLPRLLGGSTPHRFLFVFLNNAELRAGGGIAGSIAEFTASNGHLALTRQVSDAAFTPRPTPIAPLTASTRDLYGAITGEYLQDITLTPDFTQTAKLATAMWKQRFGENVDGVIALDPVTLSYLLRATGPITVGYGDGAGAGAITLTASNAVSELLSKVYATIPVPAQQDRFFQRVATAIFARLSSGSYDPSVMLGALSRADDEGRVHVWLADASLQAAIAPTTLAGTLPSSSFGVYLADSTGSKMDYYLRTAVDLGTQQCAGTGPLAVVEVTLHTTAPADAASALPRYVTGGGEFGVPAGTTRTQVTVYAPVGDQFLSASSGSTPVPAKVVSDEGHDAAQYSVDLEPGQSRSVKLLFASRSHTETSLIVTPQVASTDVTHSRSVVKCP